MKEAEYFIDTNIFLRLVAKHDLVKFAECSKLIKKIQTGEIVAFTSSLVLSEVVWTCQKFYGLKKEEIVKILNGIVGTKNLKVEDSQKIMFGIDLYAKNNVKFIDGLIASAPEILYGIRSVVSYDKDFDKLGVKRVEPSQLI